MRVETEFGTVASYSPAGDQFVQKFAEAVREQRRKDSELVATLKAQGVCLIHPDDGWVDRKRNVLIACYPKYQGDVCVGGVMALVDWRDQVRLVRIVEIRTTLMGLLELHFIEM